jgi:hypothetical protein
VSEPIDGGALPVQRRSGIDCGEAVELIPALALGAIEPAERLLLQAHCERCIDCSSELQASSYAASMLALTVPLVAPPARAKSALFGRIAPTTTVITAVPTINDELFGAPLVSSPGDKRRRKSSEGAQTVEDRFAPGSVTSPFNRWTGRVSKLAAAPLALALVLVSVYALQTRNDMQDLQAANAALTGNVAASNVSAEIAPTEMAAASFAEPTITTGASDIVAQPVLYTFSAANSGGQTGSARSISPVNSTCRMAGDGSGNYHLQISGVKLPVNASAVAVYLEAPSGQRTFLTNVAINTTGYGEATFNFDSSIPEDSILLIGAESSGSAGAQPIDGATTFLLTSDDSSVAGLGSS